MDISAELKGKGWNLSKEGLELCKEGLDRVTLPTIIQNALNMDLRDIGGNFFPEDMKGAKLENLSGSGVVQIQKIKNATAPKYEYGSGAPPILRLLLTDGNTYVNCLQWGQWKSLSMNTPPGTKIYLKPGKIPLQNSFMLLSEHQFTVLGGRVAPLVEKWEVNKRMASHVRTKENLDGTGPPPWIPFGKPISTTKTKSGNFRALDPDSKEVKEDEVFKQQRLANIAEVARAKEGKAKVFGGGKDKLPNAKLETNSYNSNELSGQNRQQRNYNDAETKQPRVPNDDRPVRNRNDQNWPNEEPYKSQVPNSNYGQPFNKDKRPDQRNKFQNSNGSLNPRNQGFEQKPYENSYRENNSDSGNASKKFQRGSNFGNNPRNNFSENPRNNFSENPRNNFGDNPRNNFADNPRNNFGDNPRNTFGDNPRNNFGDNPRNNYGNNPRNNYSDNPRNNYGDNPRNNYSDNPRNSYGDNPRNSYGDNPRNSYGDNPKNNFGDNPRNSFNPRSSNTDRFHSNDRRSNDIEDLGRRTSQIKLHGYDTQNQGQIVIPSKPFLKPGTEVNAKYWEDEKFYRATVHAVGQEGKTCVVHFMEYGNYEEVLVDDVQQLQVHTYNSGWNAGPISFQPSHWEGGNSTQDFPAISDFNPSSGRPQHNRRGGHSFDRQKHSRQDGRAGAKLYEPPQQRR